MLLVLVSLLLGGCWDREEPDDVIHVLALGFDILDDGNYRVLAQFSNPIAAAGSGGSSASGSPGSDSQKPYWVYSMDGRTPFEAIRNLSPVSTRMVDLSHVGVVLLSERLARAGVTPVLQMIYREPELRLSARWAVVDGSVEDVLKAQFPAESAPSMGLLRILMPQRVTNPGIDSGTVLKSVGELMRPGAEMSLPRLEATGAVHEGEQDTTLRSPVEYSGGAAFRDDKMVGWIKGRAVRGVNYVTDTMQRGAVLVMVPEQDGLTAVDLVSESCGVRPVTQDGGLRIKLGVEIVGHLEDQTSPDGNLMNLHDPDIIASLGRRLSEVVENDIRAAIELARDLQSDVFGFGNAVYRKLPGVWDEIGHKWDEVFLTVPVDIEVTAVVHHPGMVVSPPVAQKDSKGS